MQMTATIRDQRSEGGVIFTIWTIQPANEVLNDLEQGVIEVPVNFGDSAGAFDTSVKNAAIQHAIDNWSAPSSGNTCLVIGGRM